MTPPATLAARAGLVAVALFLWFWTQRLIGRKAPSGDAVGDRVHEFTAPVNLWLWAHPRAADALLIVTSALIDASGLYVICATILGPTLRPFVALLMLFGLRQLCQGLCTLPFPKGAIWRYPGFPSLLVTYGTSNDFFFSGHTSIAVLGALELARTAPGGLAWAAAGVAVIEAATVLVLRAHYFMDVITASFVAFGCEVAAGRLAPLVDAWLRR